MKHLMKKAALRGLLSYVISVTVTVAGGLIFLLAGAQLTVTPAFAERVGSAAVAAHLQPLLIGLIGMAFGAGSVLFEIERWSFLKQGAAHLAITAATWVAVAMVCFSPLTAPTVISSAASIGVTYAITWATQYFVWRAGVRRLNERIRERNGGINP